MLGSPGGKERDVPLDGARFPFEECLAQSLCGDDAGRVLVNVEVVIEVRHRGPFDGRILRGFHRPFAPAVIAGQQRGEDLRSALAGQGFTLLHARVDLALELGEHRLAEQRPANRVDAAGQQEHPLVVVGRALQEMSRQQRLVDRRSDLGDEDRVVRRGERLLAIAEIAVHRVARPFREPAWTRSRTRRCSS